MMWNPWVFITRILLQVLTPDPTEQNQSPTEFCVRTIQQVLRRTVLFWRSSGSRLKKFWSLAVFLPKIRTFPCSVEVVRIDGSANMFWTLAVFLPPSIGCCSWRFSKEVILCSWQKPLEARRTADPDHLKNRTSSRTTEVFWIIARLVARPLGCRWPQAPGFGPRCPRPPSAGPRLRPWTAPAPRRSSRGRCTDGTGPGSSPASWSGWSWTWCRRWRSWTSPPPAGRTEPPEAPPPPAVRHDGRCSSEAVRATGGRSCWSSAAGARPGATAARCCWWGPWPPRPPDQETATRKHKFQCFKNICAYNQKIS